MWIGVQSGQVVFAGSALSPVPAGTVFDAAGSCRLVVPVFAGLCLAGMAAAVQQMATGPGIGNSEMALLCISKPEIWRQGQSCAL